VTGEIVAPVTRSRLVRYVKTFSEHRYGRWVLAAIAFADSSFLPIPPDLLLVPMALVRPKQIWALSLICTVASSLGAVVGYLIGYGLWSLVGVPLVELYGYGNGFTAYQHLIEKWGVWIIIAKSLTPRPIQDYGDRCGGCGHEPYGVPGFGGSRACASFCDRRDSHRTLGRQSHGAPLKIRTSIGNHFSAWANRHCRRAALKVTGPPFRRRSAIENVLPQGGRGWVDGEIDVPDDRVATHIDDLQDPIAGHRPSRAE
jgi:membrane protein YqaA with SNARE-associated domain